MTGGDQAAARQARERHREIAEALTRAGLPADPVATAPRWQDASHPRRVQALVTELGRQGPLFACLAGYLATRLDSLSGDDARACATAAAPPAPRPADAVRARLEDALGTPFHRLLGHLDAEPLRTSGPTQIHRGRLADGRAVTVEIAWTDLLSAADRAVVPRLAPHLSSLGWPLPEVRRILADFDTALVRRLDLGARAAFLRELAEASSAGHRFRVAPVVGELSGGDVLTLEQPAGRPRFPATGGGKGAVRRLGDLWLHLALEARCIPEEIAEDDVGSSLAGRPVLAGGLLHPATAAEGEALRSYLVATVDHDPAAIAAALGELTVPGRRARPADLRHRLGHLVPRRDGRFGATPPGLPELLLTHWPLIVRLDLSPGPALLAFYRGLVTLRDLAGPELSAGVLEESLQVVRITRGAERLRETLDPATLARGADGLLHRLIDLPERLEAARAGDGRRSADRSREGEGRRTGRAPAATLLATGLLLAVTIALWSSSLPALVGDRAEAILAGGLALVGGALLWSLWRS